MINQFSIIHFFATYHWNWLYISFNSRWFYFKLDIFIFSIIRPIIICATWPLSTGYSLCFKWMLFSRIGNNLACKEQEETGIWTISDAMRCCWSTEKSSFGDWIISACGENQIGVLISARKENAIRCGTL